jgi:hypothetical protein
MSNMKNDTNRITTGKCNRVKINNGCSDGEITAASVVHNDERFPARLKFPFWNWKYNSATSVPLYVKKNLHWLQKAFGILKKTITKVEDVFYL